MNSSVHLSGIFCVLIDVAVFRKRSQGGGTKKVKSIVLKYSDYRMLQELDIEHKW